MSDITPCDRKTIDEIRNAPILVLNTIDLKCSAERLFAIFEDEEAWTIWGSSLEKVTWTSAKPFGVGTTRTVEMAGGIVGVEEFIVWEDNQRMAFCFTESSMPNMDAFGEDYVIEQVDEQTIRLHWYAAFWPSKLVAVFFFKLLKPVMKLLLKSFLKKLKKMCEGDYQPKLATPSVS